MERGYGDAHPQAERAAQEVLSLPVHPALSEDNLETIVAAVNGFLRGN
jgi:dTDP-4-amino-4,6-dideoxygalactose transaminase